MHVEEKNASKKKKFSHEKIKMPQKKKFSHEKIKVHKD
jgi:hypothetical protein